MRWMENKETHRERERDSKRGRMKEMNGFLWPLLERATAGIFHRQILWRATCRNAGCIPPSAPTAPPPPPSTYILQHWKAKRRDFFSFNCVCWCILIGREMRKWILFFRLPSFFGESFLNNKWKFKKKKKRKKKRRGFRHWCVCVCVAPSVYAHEPLDQKSTGGLVRVRLISNSWSFFF